MLQIGSSSLVAIALIAAATLGIAAQTPTSSSQSTPTFSCVDEEVVVNAPLADVWNAWTTTSGAQTFFAPRCEIELFPGGSYNILFMPGNPSGQRGAEGQKVLSFLPMEALSFDWGAPPQFPFARAHPGWIVIQFKAVDEARTRVRLVHLGFDELKAKYPDHAEEFGKVREYFAKAWPYVLGNLKRRFDEGPRWDAQGNELWKAS